MSEGEGDSSENPGDSGSEETEDLTPICDEYDVYLCIGQSNMAGRGYLLDSDISETVSGVYLLDGSDAPVAATHPFNQYSTIRKELSVQRMSPSYAFSKKMYEASGGRKILLVVNARGGTGIDAWASTATATNYYSEAVRRTKQACRYGKLKGIMWHQGETDAGPVASTTYMARLSNLIAAFRSELGDVPVVVGEIPDAIAESQYFNPVITTVSQHISDSACALSDGCTTISDNIHFDRDSQIVMGERFAEAMLTLQSAQ